MTFIEEIAARLRRGDYRLTDASVASGKLRVTHPKHPKPIPLATAIAEVIEDAVGELLMKERRG